MLSLFPVKKIMTGSTNFLVFMYTLLNILFLVIKQTDSSGDSSQTRSETLKTVYLGMGHFCF